MQALTDPRVAHTRGSRGDCLTARRQAGHPLRGEGWNPVKNPVLILGAGFGGLELTTRLSETLPDAVRVTLLDRNDAFVFGYSKLQVMLGRQGADEGGLPYREFAKNGVEFRQETVTAIDPVARRVTTDAETYDADYLVIAMGADYDFP